MAQRACPPLVRELCEGEILGSRPTGSLCNLPIKKQKGKAFV